MVETTYGIVVNKPENGALSNAVQRLVLGIWNVHKHGKNALKESVETKIRGMEANGSEQIINPKKGRTGQIS